MSDDTAPEAGSQKLLNEYGVSLIYAIKGPKGSHADSEQSFTFISAKAHPGLMIYPLGAGLAVLLLRDLHDCIIKRCFIVNSVNRL